MTTLDPIHPGEHLVEILDELHISQDHLAQKMGVDPIRLNPNHPPSSAYHGQHGAADWSSLGGRLPISG